MGTEQVPLPVRLVGCLDLPDSVVHEGPREQGRLGGRPQRPHHPVPRLRCDDRTDQGQGPLGKLNARVVAFHRTDLQLQPGAGGEAGQLFSGGDVVGQRLFHQDVLASLQGQGSQGRVGAVRCGHQDGVEVLLEELSHVRKTRYFIVPCNLPDQARAGIAHGHQPGPIGFGNGRQMGNLRDPAEADNTEAKLSGGRTC